MEYVRTPSQRGFEAVWQAESRLVREATVPMAAFAAVTDRIKIGSGVVNNWTRNVGLLAATFSTLDDLAPGPHHARDRRVVGSPGGEGRYRPAQAAAGDARDGRGRPRRLLAMERVTYHGEFVDVEDIEIDIVHGDRSPKQVPIYIGATGMKMMELAGEIADGVVLNYMVSPTYNRDAMAALEAGAARPAEPSTTIDRPQLVVCSLDDDRELALDRARELLTQYLGQQPHIMKASGVDPELIEEIGQVLTWPAGPEEIRRAMQLVPDEAVQLISASGTPDECRAKVREYVEAGCTCPILYPLGDDVRRDDRRVRGRGVLAGGRLLPRTLPEALELKAAHPEAMPIAGGTDVMVEINFDRHRPPALIDLTRLPELAVWRREDGRSSWAPA